MRSALILALLAQVGVIITAAEPERAERLLVRANGVYQHVKSALQRGELSDAGRQKVSASARSLLAEADAINEDARRTVAMSLSEKETMDKALARTRMIARVLLRRMQSPRPGPAPTPKPSP